MAKKFDGIARDAYGLADQVPTLAASSMACGACGRAVFGTCDRVDGVYCCMSCRASLMTGLELTNLRLGWIAFVGLVVAVLSAYAWLRLRVVARLDLFFMPLVIGELIGRVTRRLAHHRRSLVLPLLAGLLTYASAATVRFVDLLIARLSFLSLRELQTLTDADWQGLIERSLSVPVAAGPNVVPGLALLVLGVCEAMRLAHRRPRVAGPFQIAEILQAQVQR